MLLSPIRISLLKGYQALWPQPYLVDSWDEWWNMMEWWDRHPVGGTLAIVSSWEIRPKFWVCWVCFFLVGKTSKCSVTCSPSPRWIPKISCFTRWNWPNFYFSVRRCGIRHLSEGSHAICWLPVKIPDSWFLILHSLKTTVSPSLDERLLMSFAQLQAAY